MHTGTPRVHSAIMLHQVESGSPAPQRLLVGGALACLLLTVLTGVWFGAGARNTRLTFDNMLTANREGRLMLLATWRHMTRCYNIHALLHELWRRSFLHSWTKPSVVIIYRSYAIWLWCAVLRDRWSTLSSAPSRTSQRKQSLINCVFGLSSPRKHIMSYLLL
jgi:hypothetical protein